MTCAMNTVLMTTCLLWHRKIVCQKFLGTEGAPIKEIIQYIDNGDHVRARYIFANYKMKTSNKFMQAKFGDQPFNCSCTTSDMTHSISRFHCLEKTVKNECSKCKSPMRESTLPRGLVVCSVNSDKSHKKEKILDAQGYN